MWESAVNREALQQIRNWITGWRTGDVEGDEVCYDIETLLDELGDE